MAGTEPDCQEHLSQILKKNAQQPVCIPKYINKYMYICTYSKRGNRLDLIEYNMLAHFECKLRLISIPNE